MVERRYGMHQLYVSGKLSVTMVKEYLWCPAIPWIAINYGIEPPLTISMREGIQFQQSMDRARLAEELELPSPRRFEVYVESSRYRLYGVIDIVAGSKRTTIVEIKAFEKKKYFHHFEIQLMVYALLVTEKIAPVHKAILYMKSKPRIYEVSLYWLEKARIVIEKLWKTILSPEPPRISQDPRKCSYCRYRRLCPIVET